MNDKIVRFKTLVWKFRETSFKYPDHSEIPKKKITSPNSSFERRGILHPMARHFARAQVHATINLPAVGRNYFTIKMLC